MKLLSEDIICKIIDNFYHNMKPILHIITERRDIKNSGDIFQK